MNFRSFLERVLLGTLMELSNSGRFETLVEAVKQEKQRKAMLQETILKEEAGRKRMKLLQRQLTDVKKEKEIAIQERNEMIAHLKDQLQVGITLALKDTFICVVPNVFCF